MAPTTRRGGAGRAQSTAAEPKKAEKTNASKITKNVKSTTSNKSSYPSGERIFRKLDRMPPSVSIPPTPGTGYLADSEIEALRICGKANQRGNSNGQNSSRLETSLKTPEDAGGTVRSLLEYKLNTNAESASKGLRSNNMSSLRRPMASRHLSNISNVSVASSDLNLSAPARTNSLLGTFDVHRAFPDSPAKRSVLQNQPETQKALAREAERMINAQRQLFDTVSLLRQLTAGISNDLEEVEELLNRTEKDIKAGTTALDRALEAVGLK